MRIREETALPTAGVSPPLVRLPFACSNSDFRNLEVSQFLSSVRVGNCRTAVAHRRSDAAGSGRAPREGRPTNLRFV